MLPRKILLSLIVTTIAATVALLLTTVLAIPSQGALLRVILGGLIAAAEIVFLIWRKHRRGIVTNFTLPDALASVVFILATTLGLSRWVEYSLARSTAASDFAQDYLAAYAFRHGIELYGAPFRALAMTLLQLENYDNFHTPFSALLFLPLSFLPYPTAFIFWNFLSLLLFVGLVVLLLRAYGLLTFRWLRLSTVLLLWEPFTANIFLGQISIALSAGVVVSFALLRAKKDILAGVCLGVATLVKLYPGLLLLYLVFQRRWRCLGVFVAMLFGGVAIMNVTIGTDTLLSYVQFVIPEHFRIYGSYPLNISIGSGIKTIFEPTEFSQPPIPVREIGQVLTVVIGGLLILAVSVFSYLHTEEKYADDVFSLFCIAMLLTSPITWYHSCILLVLPLTHMTRSLAQETQASWRTLLLVLILCGVPNQELIDGFIAFTGTTQIPWYVVLGARTGLFGLILLYCFFWKRLAKEAGYVSVGNLFRSLRLRILQPQAFQ